MTNPNNVEYKGPGYNFGFGIGIGWFEVLCWFAKLLALPWHGVVKLFALSSDLLDYLVDGMYYYQEGRYKRGWWACRFGDMVMMTPLVLIIVIMGLYPPVIKAVLTLYFWWYAVTWLTLKLLIYMVWDSLASIRRSEYWTSSQGVAQSSPDEAKSLLLLFGLIIMIASMTYAHFTFARAKRIVWFDPLKPAWSFKYTPAKYPHRTQYKRPTIFVPKKKAPIGAYSAAAAKNRKAHTWNDTPAVQLWGPDLFSGRKILWRYKGSRVGTPWNIGYIHSYKHYRIWISKKPTDFWPTDFRRSKLEIVAHKD